MRKSLVHLAVSLALALALGSSQAVRAATGPRCYVDVDAGVTDDGNSWGTAYLDLQSGLGDSNCTEIWVAAGVYKPTSTTTRTISFVVQPNVAVYGGFAGTETLRSQHNPAANVTILSGDIDSDDANGDGNNIAETTADIVCCNSYHVVMMDGTGSSDVTSSTVLDGFTITAGQADTSGGGLRCDGPGAGSVCSPTLTNLTFSGNYAPNAGGGMFDGGASGGISSPTLTDVTFSGNTAGSAGGGMYNNGNGGTSSPSLLNVTFSGNDAPAGGGMYNDGSFGGLTSPLIRNATFSGNHAVNNGGGMVTWSDFGSDPVLISVTFKGNSTSGFGGAIYNASTGSPFSGLFDNVILWGNTASSPSAGPEIYNDGTVPTPDIEYSIIQGSGGSGGSWDTSLGNDAGFNLDADPMLAALANNGGFTKTMALLFGSSAIDTGEPACPPTDQRGVLRPQGPHCDIGAFEVAVPTITQLYPPASSTACLTPRVGVDVILIGAMRTGAGSFNPATVTLKLDTINVTPSAKMSQDLTYPANRATILYTPPSNLSPGIHTVQFTYPTEAAPQTRTWNFTAASSTCPLMAEASAEPSLLSAPELTELASPGADNSEPPAPTTEPGLLPIPEPSQAPVLAPGNSTPEEPYPLLIGRPR